MVIRATFIDILEEEEKVSRFIGVDRYERTPARLDWRADH